MAGIDEKLEISILYGRMRTIAQVIKDLKSYENALDSLNRLSAETRESCNTFLHIQKSMASSGDAISDIVKHFEMILETLGKQMQRLQYEKSILEMQLSDYSGVVVPQYIYDRQSVGGRADYATNWYLSEVSKYFTNEQGEFSGSNMKAFFDSNPSLYPPDMGAITDPKAITHRIERLNKAVGLQSSQ
jgi:hypothetical protein